MRRIAQSHAAGVHTAVHTVAVGMCIAGGRQTPIGACHILPAQNGFRSPEPERLGCRRSLLHCLHASQRHRVSARSAASLQRVVLRDEIGRGAH